MPSGLYITFTVVPIQSNPLKTQFTVIIIVFIQQKNVIKFYMFNSILSLLVSITIFPNFRFPFSIRTFLCIIEINMKSVFNLRKNLLRLKYSKLFFRIESIFWKLKWMGNREHFFDLTSKLSYLNFPLNINCIIHVYLVQFQEIAIVQGFVQAFTSRFHFTIINYSKKLYLSQTFQKNSSSLKTVNIAKIPANINQRIPMAFFSYCLIRF